jgi:glyoxylase-like metal-dependent hydrolase (beta-lactamase superfamily II)
MGTTFEMSDITVHRIIEGECPFKPAPEFLAGLTPELLAENRPWMQPTFLDEQDRVLICVQSYVLRTPHHVILIDSCVGNNKTHAWWPAWHMKTDDTYLRGLSAAGVSVDDIDIVMCTHLHGDHVGWNTRLENGRWVPTFPRARYLFAENEFSYWTERAAKASWPHFNESVLPIVEAGRHQLVSSAHELDDHIRLIPTPGHTPDHFAVAIGRGRDDAVITGDLIHTPLQARYPEISPAWDFDPVQSGKTRRDFLERYCDTPTLCCTAHFPSPSRMRVKRWGDGFACESVTS